MPARSFQDSTGAVWEVFEVRRTSQKALAVSVGLEHGWLSFVNGDNKRRLAPFPREWETATPAELERLCATARVVRHFEEAMTASSPRGEEAAPATTPPRAKVPRIRSRTSQPVPSAELPIVSTATGADSVESTVRTFAHQARAGQLPAIEAMVQLKALLARVYPEPSSSARDLRAVRRWFVDAFYFERETALDRERDQSL
ncbi:MAG TPA: hypothetical protein VFI52_02390 [Gemmatimonadaceae bacterium]|nr:hypothetical protein [Gemmatimonadaceae bacterium]